MALCGIGIRISLLYLLFSGVVGAQQSLVVTPDELSFAANLRPNLPVSGTIGVSTRSGPPVPLTATVRYLGPVDGWLSVTASSPTTPATLTVTADPTRLSAGTYLGQVAVSAGGIGRTVSVFLTVGAGTPGARGTFAVSPSSLTFVGQQGVAILPHQTITVTNADPSAPTQSFRAIASSSGWLTVSPLPETTPATVAVTAIQSGLSAGNYSGTVTLIPLSSGAPTVIPVTLNATGVTATQDALKLTQTAINVTHQFGPSIQPPPVQVVGITATTGFTTYTATTQTSWLKLTSTFQPTPVSTLTDFAPGEFRIVIDPTGLQLGPHQGNVEISATGLPTVNLPVSLTITSTPAFNAQPSSVLLDDTTGQEATVTITHTGQTVLSFNATPSPGSEWISVTPNTGTTAGAGQQLTVRLNTSALSAGIHAGSVLLTPQAGSSTAPPLAIPVRTTVSAASAIGALLFSTDAVSLTGVSAGPNPSQIIEIRPESGGLQEFTASATSPGGWLSVQPFAGVAPGRVTVSANLAAVAGFGTHSGTLTITSLATGQQFTIPVTLEYAGEGIVANPASVTFIQPGANAAPPSEAVEITSPVPSTWRVLDKPNWVTVTPMQGSTPDSATFFAEMSLVPPGTNTGVVRIQGPRNTLSVPVSIRVADAPGPGTSPEPINLTYSLGAPSPASRTIAVENGGRPATFTVAVTTESGVPWLRATPTSGSAPGSVLVSIDSSRLTTGRHTGSVAITTTNGSTQTRTYPVVLTVNIPAASIQSVLHAATMNPTTVAPGQLISITGSGLGPAAGVAARPTAAGAYDTRLGDTRVLFDGNPAPVLYARHDQINAIVPYSVHGRLSTRINVDVAGNWSLPVEVRVVDAAPGIFTATGTARGPAAAVNADFTTNSATNPAPRGSVISVFGTGEGQTDPAGQDGRVIATDLRRPLLPVTATIGGRPADVLYAGSAAMQVSGIFQINIRVPDDIEPGAVPLEVRVGGVASQSGVTIVVR